MPLLSIVFITGAAVLVIEVAATRILSPYFGNTIFTVSSVLTVILLALSLGYYFGGRLADQRASEKFFYKLIALSGGSVLLLQLLNVMFLPFLSTTLSLQYGPLIASVLLFLLPGFLLGLLSPLVITLQHQRLPKQGIGQIAGEVFFWSTLGSIVGSLATGFFLIPHVGVSQIILGTGMLLLSIGLIGLSRRYVFIVLFLPFISLGFSSLHDSILNANAVYAADGTYDNMYIYDGEYKGQKTRFLKQGTDASSAMFLDSQDLVYDYTKYYSVYKLTNPNIRNALVIGGGAYSVPKALLQDVSDVSVDVAEIEPGLFDIGKKYFRVPNDPRLQNHVEDGRRFLQTTDKKYDLIFTDAFHFSIPAHLTTQEFFKLSKEKLAPKGVFVMNIGGRLVDETPSFLLSEIKTFRSIYPNSDFFAVYSPDIKGVQNIIMVGYNGSEKVDFDKEHRIDSTKYKVDEHPLFTDDYAPAEYFIAKDQVR